ncbi:hypothetical protein F0562_003100 [Nyssa sinensis]|uniref:Uncharacterized protein n=1 Tax=Nyssa sinensis TaxID=561372 RepID=A0A5J5BUJ8_9ASTE|nr:hypothetical protein F0562_003100 [Nyssa sinensis]
MASSPVLSVAPVTPPSIHSLVTIKLSSENYLLWKAQIMPYLRGQRLFGYVDGSCLQPSQHIPNPEADKSPAAPRLLLNPEFSHWFDQDQIVLSILMSSLSESILAKVIGVTTSREVWCALEKMYSSHSRARLSTTRRQLSTVTKGGMSISDYFQTVKSLADTLAAIGHPHPDTEIVSYLLGGLDSSYDPIVTSIQTREDPMELEDIFGHLLTFELRLQQHTQVLEATIGSANVATRTDYSRGPHGKTQYSNRASSYSGSRGRGRGRGGRHGSPGGPKNVSSSASVISTKGYKCLDPESGRVFVSRHVIFDESVFPFSSPTSSSVPAATPSIASSTLLPFLLPSHDHSAAAAAVVPHSSPHIPASLTEPTTTSASSLSFSPAASTASPPLFSSSPTISPVPAPSDAALPSESLPSRSHPMTTRSQNNIVKPKQFFDGTTRGVIRIRSIQIQKIKMTAAASSSTSSQRLRIPSSQAQVYRR